MDVGSNGGKKTNARVVEKALWIAKYEKKCSTHCALTITHSKEVAVGVIFPRERKKKRSFVFF